VRAESESREKRVRAERDVFWSRLACFGLGKWFTEIFSVNRFPFFPSHFTVKRKYFQFDFCFTLQQTPANAENVLRKTFSAETNEKNTDFENCYHTNSTKKFGKR
jgi:hypothetical protein